MKNLFFILTLICWVKVNCTAQLNIPEIDKSLIKINDTLYASKYEVSNKLYRDYTDYLKNNNKISELNIVIVDSNQWLSPEYVSEPFAHFYHTHPAYDNYPVVNISFNAAKKFCEWLTKEYNSDSKRKFKKVIFKLPSEKEWIIAAKGKSKSSVYGWKGKSLKNIIGKKKGNYFCGDTIVISNNKDSDKDYLNFIGAIDEFKHNSFGIDNMSGNVAEMLNQKGVAKGGDWRHCSEYLEINSNFQYDGNPKPFIGFRYFVLVIEK